MGDVGAISREILLISLASIPLGVSLWALLDIARRPAWAWGLAGRNRVGWLAAVLIGMCSVLGGLVVSGWYLVRVRPAVADAEEGRLRGG
jgi:hypothetical protein